jgi:ferredoxin
MSNVLKIFSLLLLTGSSALVPPHVHFRPSVSKSTLNMAVIQASSAQAAGNSKQTTTSSLMSSRDDAVDMNRYNLESLDLISQEWTAVVTASSSLMAEGIYLQARSKDVLMADTVKVSFPRIAGMGLGLELLELAGGREDGVGITVISDLVEDGAAIGSGLLPGDSIVKIEVRSKTTRQTSSEGLQEKEELFSVQTECYGYDRTVDAILSLLSYDDSLSDMYVLTVKRLRRKPKVQLNLIYPPEMGEENISLELFAGENLRRALLVRGVKLNDKLASRFDSGGTGDCGAEGTCATCAVSIIDGKHLLSPAGQQETQIFVKHPRWRMACKTVVGYGMKEGTITVRVNPRQWDS